MNIPPDRGEEDYYYLPPLPPEATGGDQRRLDRQVAIQVQPETGLLHREPRSDNNAIYPPGWMGHPQHYQQQNLLPPAPGALSFYGAVNPSFNAETPAEQKRPWKKPPGFPKRPLSAYNLFFRDQREKMLEQVIGEDARQFQVTDQSRRKHRKTHGKIGFQEMAQKIASDWRSLSDEQRKPYRDEAKREKAKYQEALKKFKESQIEDPQPQQRQQQPQPTLQFETPTLSHLSLENEGITANLPARRMRTPPSTFQPHQRLNIPLMEPDHTELNLVRAETAQMLASFGNYQQHYPTTSERLRGTFPQTLRAFPLSSSSPHMSRRSTFPADSTLPPSSSSTTMTTAAGYPASAMLDNHSLRASYPPSSSQTMLLSHQETLQQQYDDYPSFLSSEHASLGMGYGGGGRDFSASTTGRSNIRRLSTSSSSWRQNTPPQLGLYRQADHAAATFASRSGTAGLQGAYTRTGAGFMGSYHHQQQQREMASIMGQRRHMYEMQQQLQDRESLLGSTLRHGANRNTASSAMGGHTFSRHEWSIDSSLASTSAAAAAAASLRRGGAPSVHYADDQHGSDWEVPPPPEIPRQTRPSSLERRRRIENAFGERTGEDRILSLQQQRQQETTSSSQPPRHGFQYESTGRSQYAGGASDETDEGLSRKPPSA